MSGSRRFTTLATVVVIYVIMLTQLAPNIANSTTDNYVVINAHRFCQNFLVSRIKFGEACNGISGVLPCFQMEDIHFFCPFEEKTSTHAHSTLLSREAVCFRWSCQTDIRDLDKIKIMQLFLSYSSEMATVFIWV